MMAVGQTGENDFLRVSHLYVVHVPDGACRNGGILVESRDAESHRIRNALEGIEKREREESKGGRPLAFVSENGQ